MSVGMSASMVGERALAAETKAHFDDFGWALARGVLSGEDVARISGWIGDLQQRPEIPGAHWVYRQPSLLDPRSKVIQRIENFCPHHADFDAFARESVLSRAIEQLLGGPAFLFKEKINFKEPGGAGFELHQDQQAGWSHYAPLFVTAMVCIDPATVENGCLQVAVGHPRFDHLIAEEWRPIAAQETDGFTLRAVPTKPGDVIFFDSYFPHASEDNLTADRRRMLFMTYNSADYGDVRDRYHQDKRANFPPDIEREAGVDYQFRV
jgi:ectoine hydroxylase-related dioxygenase (phytanoyl-CoA dioxygenase family)